ncbi:hypothetical protein [Couchioplanes azureus]|uniref:hypothetical protein n=1 Tax=Couchioplanes caeruleus TaxID=56438 RepID=UPI0016710717|nr:hypothetical protein [Couchioplanes caeruleus]GGQ68007.1 hypothetical protein GCM10010166_42510 [Couchioplanes caeruleus subsp. azureus]
MTPTSGTTSPDIRIEDLHIGVEHECKWELPWSGTSDPGAVAAATLFTDLLSTGGRARDYLQSVLYLDDAEGSLAGAGHSLSIVVNSGAPSGTCVIAFKQTVHHRGWRDGLEVRQRVPHRQVGARLDDPATLPVARARSLGRVTGPLRPAGVAVQRRYKCHGLTADGTEIFCSIDRVEFGRPGGVRDEQRRYACLEIEVNSSLPAALAGLGRLAGQLDDRLGVPRDRTSKSQRAWAYHLSGQRGG